MSYPVIYVRLEYDDYKDFENALTNYKTLETVHTSVEGFYHKAFRLPLGPITLEVHGPAIKG